ncbi:immunity 22 family protein [Alteromonas sediminis]|nr:immunity 22 family protein [Alteromonas sediminis]
MTMFTRPDFLEEKSKKVSIWASTVPQSEIPDDYFAESYGEDDDYSEFCKDFNMGWYDHDFAEIADEYGENNLEKLSLASFGESFAEEACKQCGDAIIDVFFLLYDIKYDPSRSGVKESKYFRFIGVFNYEV